MFVLAHAREPLGIPFSLVDLCKRTYYVIDIPCYPELRIVR